MPSVKVFDMAGKEVGAIELSDVIFGAEVNGAVLHAAVRAYLMNQRQGTQSTLTRTEVSGIDGSRKFPRGELFACWRRGIHKDGVRTTFAFYGAN